MTREELERTLFVVDAIVVQDDEDPVGVSRGEWYVGAVFADDSYLSMAFNAN